MNLFFFCEEERQYQRKDRKDIIYIIEVWFKWQNITIYNVKETYNFKNVILKTITMKSTKLSEIALAKKWLVKNYLRNHLSIPLKSEKETFTLSKIFSLCFSVHIYSQMTLFFYRINFP